MLAEVWPTAIPIWGKQHQIRAWALVDSDDWARLGKRCWSMTKGYAYRMLYLGGGRANARQQPVRMHRELMGLERGDPREVDHINGDRLDNRRCNLRVLTRGQNAQNVVRSRGGVRGVSFHRQSGRWRARVCTGGREYSKLCATPEEAAVVAAELRRQHLPFAVEARHAA